VAAFLVFAGFLFLDAAGVAAALVWLSSHRARRDERRPPARGLPEGQR
jgi:hypothetical protein